MITEDYVSFEIAELLKEKGFDGNTFYKYADKEGVVEEWYNDYRERMVRFNWDYGTLITPPTEPQDKYRVYGDTIPAPSLALATKWLREKYNLNVCFRPVKLPSKIEWRAYIFNKDCEPLPINAICGKIYEEACEAAIKYCLEKLI